MCSSIALVGVAKLTATDEEIYNLLRQKKK
jgi:hypothetical protein